MAYTSHPIPAPPVTPPASCREDRMRRVAGFTMIEVLVVALVLGALSAIAVPEYLTHRAKARVAAVGADARNVGAMIEDAWAKDRVYPDTLASNAGNVLGARLSPKNKVARYARDADGQGFELCIIYTTDPSATVVPATAQAYAIYDSNDGGMITKKAGPPPGGVCAANSTAAVTPITTDTGSGGGGGGGAGGTGDTSGGGASAGAPQNVAAAADPGQTAATVTWDAPAGGADSYEVFLDGAATPAWTGTTLTGNLTGLTLGAHEVRVGAVKAGEATAKSEPVAFIIYGDNDLIVNAHPIPDKPDAEWYSRDYSTSGTTAAEAGETDPNNLYSRWWTVTAPRDTNYYFEVAAPVVNSGSGFGQWYYPELYVWKTAATSTAGGLGATVVDSSATGGGAAVRFVAKAGETFKVRVSTQSGGTNHGNRPYRLLVGTGPTNDFAAAAATIPSAVAALAPWRSPDVRTKYASIEDGESGGSKTVWWNFSPSVNGTYWFNIVGQESGGAPYEHHTYDIWQTPTATPIASLGGASASQGGSYRSASGITLVALAGQTYKIRVSGNTDTPMRLQVTRGPANDFLADAAPVPALTVGVPWLSEDLDNTRAGAEAGEPGKPSHGMWWTYTATNGGTLKVEILAPTDAATAYGWRYTAAYRTTSTDVATLAAATKWEDGYMNDYAPILNIPLTAGQTYKIRAASYDVSMYGRYRLKLTLS